MPLETSIKFKDEVVYNENDMAGAFHGVFGDISNLSATTNGLNLIITGGYIMLGGFYIQFVGTQTIPIPANSSLYTYIEYDFSEDTSTFGTGNEVPSNSGTIKYMKVFTVVSDATSLKFDNPLPARAVSIYKDYGTIIKNGVTGESSTVVEHTCLRDGIVELDCEAVFGTTTATVYRRGISIYLNGVLVNRDNAYRASATNGTSVKVPMYTMVACSLGDVISMKVISSSGGETVTCSVRVKELIT